MDLHVNQLPSSNFFFFPLSDQTFYHPPNQLQTFPNSPIEDIQKRERSSNNIKKKKTHLVLITHLKEEMNTLRCLEAPSAI